MYTLEYFIKKFEAIPEENWYTGDYINPNNINQKCAFGHCSTSDTTFIPNDESTALVNLTINREDLSLINDGKVFRYQQPTPKQRVLACLNDLLKSKSTIPE